VPALGDFCVPRSPVRRDEFVHSTGQLRPRVFLQEMASLLDGRMRLTFRARHAFEERSLAARGDRVAVAE